ncbi:hypothetical protein MAR_025131 [Mya arenaria]|uniref:Uncharacterized protein n=1 Tax=Mya arenaria TaxID=6604 RepID=A0ABY7DUJ0_MYAAR|nr:hypothetical protein MAR_025131 [Mya arenaria]
MKTLLQTLLCFVSVAQCLSQMGRRRTVVKKPVVFDQNPIFHPKPLGPKLNHPKPVVKPEVFGVENSAFGQGRLWGNGAEPDFNRLLSGGSQFGRPLRSGEGSFMGGSSELELIRELQGSTKFGRILRAGETIDGILLPEHGGTLEVSGITADGRGAVIPGGLPKTVFNDGWQHPWGGNSIPSDYAGQELILTRLLDITFTPKM